MPITFANYSDVGMVREENQDFFGKYPEDNLDLSSPKGQLFVVADGMGGHNAGRAASEMAVNALAYSYFSIPSENIAECLKRAFEGANKQIYAQSKQSPEFEGMGTTCVALVLKADRAYVGHVGDSRVYQITRRKVQQLTGDHSVVAQMVRQGILTDEEARVHPQRSHLYRALGVRPDLEVDILDGISARPSDYFLLCTDGLHTYLTDKEMQEVVTSNVPLIACQELIRVANARGGLDNITVQIVHVERASGFMDKLIGEN